MIFFSRKPKSKDIDYVENMFGIIYDSYPNHVVSCSTINGLPKIENKEDLTLYLNQIAKEMCLNVKFQFTSTDIEDINDTPISIDGDSDIGK